MFNNTNQNNEEQLHESEEVHIIQPLLPITENSIANRFVRSHEIRLMSELPEEINGQFNAVTIITPEGLFQLNQETNTLKCLLDTDQLDQLGLSDFVEYSEHSMPEEGTLIQEALTPNSLTLKQLSTLEFTVINVGGHTVIGYPINTSIWLKIIGYLFREKYPPKPEDYSRRWWEALHKPIFQDILLALKVTMYSFIVFVELDALFIAVDALKNSKRNFRYSKLFDKNISWICLSVAILFVINISLLRNSQSFKPIVFSRMNCIRRIGQNMIVSLVVLSSQTSLLILSKIFKTAANTVTIYSVIPLFILATKLGVDDNDDFKITPALNIFHHPKFRTFLNAISNALTTSSFVIRGVTPYTGECLELIENTMDDYVIHSQTENAFLVLQSSIFVFIFLTNLARYPYAAQSFKKSCRYISNIGNAIGNVFLICYTIHLVELAIWVSFYTLDHAKSWKKPDYMFFLYIFYLCLQPLNLLCSFMIAFPMTTNLPELSIEPQPPEKTWCEKISEYIESITQYFQHTGESMPLITTGSFFRINPVKQTDNNETINLNSDEISNHDI